MTKTIEESRFPHIGQAQLTLLERLSNACSVSGDEGEVRKIVLHELKPHADELKVDALGNVLVTRHAAGKHCLKVMVAAHMDEVGIMLTHDKGKGIYRFEIVGDLTTANLTGKLMWVGKKHIPGVIGIKAIHLTEPEERRKPFSTDDMLLDVGPASGLIKVGDRAAFATSFMQLGPSLRGKAMDNRLGVATLIELVKHAPPQIDLLAAFTVQEEIGLRGARVAAYTLNPDLAFILDSTAAYDLPAWEVDENVRYNTHLGAGPAIYLADAKTISDPRLVKYLMEIAEANHLPYQIRQPGGDETDAGAIHRQRMGIPSVSISVPARYHHSPASIVRLSDWQNTYNLVVNALSHLSPEILKQAR